MAKERTRAFVFQIVLHVEGPITYGQVFDMLDHLIQHSFNNRLISAGIDDASALGYQLASLNGEFVNKTAFTNITK
jgi:hypothetical protein